MKKFFSKTIGSLIAATLIVYMLCGCSNGVIDKAEILKNDYYDNNVSIHGYELFVSDDKSFAIQLPENSYILQEKEHMLCQANEITISLGWGDNDFSNCYTNIDELKSGLESAGINLLADIVSFEALYEGDEYRGYKYMTRSSKDIGRTVCYYMNYFCEDKLYGFVIQLPSQDFINIADKIINSFYLFDNSIIESD